MASRKGARPCEVFMSCNHPFYAFWTGNYTENGKKEYILNVTPGDYLFNVAQSKVRISPNAPMEKIGDHVFLTEKVPIPCGKCIGCRMTKAKNWAVRLSCEAKYYLGKTFFITLTYDDFHKPLDLTLVKVHIRNFLKDLRGRTKRQHRDFRYFYCFEYGTQTLRPHFHIILFGDLELGEMIAPNCYHSPLIEKCWPFGLHEVSYADYGTFSYTAGYVMKKQEMIDKYQFKQPPYVSMSDKPPIGWRDAQALNGRKDYRVYAPLGENKYSAPIPKAFFRHHLEDDWYTDYKKTIIDLQEKGIYISLAQFGTSDIDVVGFIKDSILEKKIKEKEERKAKRI